ncbi:hypothetical protein JQ621_26460 [Bradyrhizobium manausense]|uniref:hypothetical protein n=1 Tax=Bradyrhizobium manausense TaxID=989370 RepID=UPI001BAD7F06|nr:hypothetical protein [Bradyrhizobium manausense]MBR1091019.1 hypothetical protein [Bradyrhizobium manausense]
MISTHRGWTLTQVIASKMARRVVAAMTTAPVAPLTIATRRCGRMPYAGESIAALSKKEHVAPE